VGVVAVAAGIVALTLRSRGVEPPPPPPTPTGPEVVTVVAVGDIACDPASSSFNGGEGTGTECEMGATSDLALRLDPDAVLALGDLQYECGGYEAFLASYDPSWGRLKDITHPVPGNHEYDQAASDADDGTDCSAASDASGYFRYFGDAAGTPGEGWYSFDLGRWHMIALNSNCPLVGGCGENSPQGRWLAADLAANDRACTLAFWHHPMFSSGRHGNDEAVAVMWEMLTTTSGSRCSTRTSRPIPTACGRSWWAPEAGSRGTSRTRKRAARSGSRTPSACCISRSVRRRTGGASFQRPGKPRSTRARRPAPPRTQRPGTASSFR
jgi:hypothetical protein